MLNLHEEACIQITGAADQLFALLDDPTRLTEHMSKRSWRMGWGRLETTLDDGRGRSVGSHIRVHGRVLAILLHLDEVITQRDPPRLKEWETVGEPRLLVIGSYRMRFEVAPKHGYSELRVSIDYDLPRTGAGTLLGRIFGRTYAKWCTRRMVQDAQRMFAR